MEYLTNRPESTTFSHFISLFLLFFMLLRSFGIHASIKYAQDYPPELQSFVYADKTPYNEKLWWIDMSKQNEKLICSQRTRVFSEFYDQSSIECTLATPINGTKKARLPGVNRLAECVSDGHVVLCQNPDGTVVKYTEDAEDNQPEHKRPRVRFIKKS